MSTYNKMNFKKAGLSLISTALLTAFSANSALAQEEEVERIEVTGSSIKRTDMEGALPIQVITAEDIAKTGVTSVGDLIAQLPAMQGFTTPGDSVGGSGGGIVTANLRDLGEQYTLVLLNGRRVASADSGSIVDLSNIPVAALKRIDVLTDGASALYGSDAIAGVVNFILKDEVEESTFTIRTDKPQESGGEKFNASFTTGFGDFDRDGYSVVLSVSHESQKQLAAADRDFANTGMIAFDHEGYDDQLFFFNGSGNAIPGNARVRYYDRDEDGNIIYALNEDGSVQLDEETGDPVPETFTKTFNPYSAVNGSCAENTSPIGDECWFDYTSTIEIVPERDRNSFYGRFDLAVTEDLRAYSYLNLSKSSMTARIAPYPTGWFTLPMDNDLVTQTVLPNAGLTDTQLDLVQNVAGRWRALPAGNRTTEYETLSYTWVTAIEGNLDDIEYSGGISYSVFDQDQNYPDGWLYRDAFTTAAGNGDFNVFAPASEFSADDQKALSATVYSGPWDNIKNTNLAIDGKMSMPLFELANGEAYLATGFDYRMIGYDRSIADANANQELLFLSADTPYELERNQYGVFAELLMPLFEGFELNTSVRYDAIGAVSDKLNGGDINDSESDVTYKISMNWAATDDLKLRASYGTGFKAPSMREIAEPRSDFGVTSGNYSCPFSSSNSLAKYCLSGESQLGVYREGNPELKPETSKQYSFGFVYSPSTDFSLTMDYWNIKMENLVERLTESQIIENPSIYPDLFTTRTNLSTGEEELAIIQQAVNAGTSDNSGIDYNIRLLNEIGSGTLTTDIAGTYVIESDSSLTGSSLGRFGDDDAVTFRNIFNINNTFAHGDFQHTLGMNYRSGYTDQEATVNILESDGSLGDEVTVQKEIPSYILFDFQTKYTGLAEGLALTLGINNLFDKQPHLSLRSGGAGHQVGWDPRYTDAYGRTFYLQADYSF